MKPVIKLHETYQSFVIEQLQQHYAGGLLVLVNKDHLLMREEKKLNDLINAALQSMHEARFADATVKLYKCIFTRF